MKAKNKTNRFSVEKTEKNRTFFRWSSSLLLGLTFIFAVTACSFTQQENSASYIYLIRHGRTYSNEQELLVGRGGNYDLTEEAVSQAKAVGETLAADGVDFDQAYSSTLGRAYDTATYILEGAGQETLEVQQKADLDDISWGDAEGYTQEQFMEEYHLETFPDAFGSADDADFVSPIHAESKYDFCQRFDRGMSEIAEQMDAGDTVLVAAHSSIQFWLEQQFPEVAGKGIDNLGITILKVEGDEFQLVEYNTVLYNQ